jgi:RNA polymerase sigma-70 factor (ECF subfamily)
MVDRSDLELSLEAAEGDEAAFELLVHRHVENVWRLARFLLADDFEAEDAVQETFVKAYRSRRSFRGEASYRTWLLSICHRTCVDHLRRRSPEVVSLSALRQERAAEETLELRLLIEEGIELLPTEERHAFVLVHVLGYSREEAARICDVPASTLRSRVSRARERLAAMMAQPTTEWSEH